MESNFENLLQKAEDFSNLETLVELKGTQTEITQTKKDKRQELIKSLENLKLITSLKFKKGTANYRAFHGQNLTLQKDAELCITAAVMAKLGMKYLSELTQYGLTLAALHEITILKNEFLELIITKELAQFGTVENNRSRILFGNEIHTELMRYTTTGMSIWRDTSAARYNDYVMYDVKKPKKTA